MARTYTNTPEPRYVEKTNTIDGCKHTGKEIDAAVDKIPAGNKALVEEFSFLRLADSIKHVDFYIHEIEVQDVGRSYTSPIKPKEFNLQMEAADIPTFLSGTAVTIPVEITEDYDGYTFEYGGGIQLSVPAVGQFQLLRCSSTLYYSIIYIPSGLGVTAGLYMISVTVNKNDDPRNFVVELISMA